MTGGPDPDGDDPPPGPGGAGASAPGRLGALRQRLEEEGLPGLLVSHPPNVRYLSGFTGSAGWLLVRAGDATLITDSRYREQAAEQVAPGVGVRVAEDGLARSLAERLGEGGSDDGDSGWRFGFEAHRVTVRQRRKLEEDVAGVDWRETDDWVEDLRAVKDDGELGRLEDAARTTCRALEDFLAAVEPGATESELVAELEYRLRRAGSGPPAFESIVAGGPRSALPHARPSDRPVREGELLLVDVGATVEGYASDLTRTVVVGTAEPWQRELFDAVRAARDAAVDAVEAGRPAREVDARARDTLEEHGLGEAFGHSTGHGVGLEVHEGPSVSRRSEAILREGNVVTIEPGVYLRGRGGVRLEDVVAVEESGSRVLTEFSRGLIEL